MTNREGNSGYGHGEPYVRRARGRQGGNAAVLFVLLCGSCHWLTGCGDKVELPSAARLADFRNAGPIHPLVDVDQLVRAKIPTGPYRVVSGDSLQLEMPRVLDPQASATAGAEGGRTTYTLHVSDAGTITLPMVGDLAVAGKTLTELEDDVASAFYPELVRAKPSIYARVLEHRAGRVSVVGAVARPGIYELRHDQMSLIALLMQAGGIVDEGAARIRIARTVSPDDRPCDGADSARGSTRASQPRAQRAVWTGASGGNERSESGHEFVVFDPEGALPTTGWLKVERGDRVLCRRWLDVASEHQRRMFAGALAERAGRAGKVAIEAKLQTLAGLLEALAGQHASVSATDHFGWQRQGERFVATAGAPFSRPIRLVSNDRLGGAKKTLHGARWASLDPDRAYVETLVLPVRGLNIPFEDVHLNDGDSVIVERLETQYVSVLGLVSAPGRFPYPAEARYTLAETLALAGGLDLVADPRYVTIYRPKTDGTVASATFQLVNPKKQEELTDRLALILKPGDVVSVEHTPRTRTNVFLDRILRISLGLYINPEELWESDG
jgi:protein involved in polysaccharide export with SLBB domain